MFQGFTMLHTDSAMLHKVCAHRTCVYCCERYAQFSVNISDLFSVQLMFCAGLAFLPLVGACGDCRCQGGGLRHVHCA